MSRRRILELVRSGELPAAEAAALIAVGAAPREDAGHGTLPTVRCFAPGWEQGDRSAVSVAGTRAGTVFVLDRTGGGLPTFVPPTGAVLVHATHDAGLHREDDSTYRVGARDESAWARLWRETGLNGPAPERIVIITASGPERCLDAVYPALATLVRERVHDRLAVACVAVGDDRDLSADALGGFCGIAAQEDRRLRMVSLSVDPSADLATLALGELARTDQPLSQVRYDGGGRWVRVMPSVELAWDKEAELADEGVYLVTGGAGGIGLALAELLASRFRARCVLMGRTGEADIPPAALARIQRVGGRARYVSGDVTRLDDVRAAVAVAREEFGPLTGVLHLAGVNADSYIANKAPSAHHGVLDPKVMGARNLDEATRDEPLTSFVLFSSMAAYLGHPGQSDYAAAGRALGGFAARRAAQVAGGHRSGTTVAIGWPLWDGGGMRLSASDELAVATLQGMTAMPAETGLAVMSAALRADRPETVVVYGDGRRIDRFVADRLASGRTSGAVAPSVTPAAVRSEDDDLVRAASAHLVEVVSGLARMRPGQLAPDQEFSALGIDSVMIKRLSVSLEDFLGCPMPVTLLFEHRTVNELARHLATAFEEPLRSALHRPDPLTTGSSTAFAPDAAPAPPAPEGASADEAVAIVGLAGRYPGADDVGDLWELLSGGRDSTGEIPADRWDKDLWHDTGDRRPGSSYGRWGGFLSGVTRFDSLFFSIAPREARRMDPAERLFLEVAWSALEDAGYTRARLHRATRTEEGHALGVFVGTTGLAYGLVGAEEWGKGNPVSAHSMEFSLANRLSYFLDAHGPSMSVDTACSASLTALHLACESLRRGESRMAVAGGAYLNLHPLKYAMLSEQRMMSPDGVCRPFGEGGNGFVPGEGVGAVVLKPLSAALADGDHVHAVIRSTSISHGGRTNGYTVPSPKGHAAVIRSALRRAGVDPRTIGYVEAHGTGTELGDPIEIDGLERAFREYTPDRGFCSIGSVKGNIGHAEAAAGIAGLTKVLLQLRHRKLAPTLHSDPPNPRIDFAATPFRLQRSLEPWHATRGGTPRRAAVSSFGAGGANAHLIVEEFGDREGSLPGAGEEGKEHLILLSARTPDRLTAMAERLARALTRPDAPRPLRDIAHTLRVGREPFAYRRALVVASVDELVERLRQPHEPYEPQHIATAPGDGPAGTSRRSTDELLRALRWRELGDLWARGADIDWTAAPGTSPRPSIVPLPGYPFAGPSHWPSVRPAVRPGSVSDEAVGARGGAPLVEVGNSDGAAEFALDLPPTDPVIADHVVDGRPVLAGVAHLELVRAAAARLTGHGVAALTDVRWRAPLDLDTGAPTVLLTAEGDTVRGQVITRGPDGTTVHATMTASTVPGEPAGRADPAALRSRCTREESANSFYGRAAEQGLAFGPAYRLVRRMYRGDGEAFAELSATPGGGSDWWLEPGATDAALHTLHGAVPFWDEPATLPVSVARVDLVAPSGQARYAHARLVEADPARGTVRCDVDLYDEDGRPLVRFAGLTAVRPARTGSLPAYRPVWRLTGPVWETPGDRSGTTLVFTTERDHGLGAAIVRRAGADARLVDITALASAEAFGRILRELPTLGHVYFLGGVERRRYSPTDLDHLELSQRHGCLALFHLARSIAELRPQGTRLTVVTNDSQQTDDALPTANPFAASLHGLTRTLAREMPFLTVVGVDVAGAELAHCSAADTWDTLLARIDAEPGGLPHEEVVLRDGARLTKRLMPVRMPEGERTRSPFRAGGRYLVVGGAGGLGAAISERLARDFGARLLIVGRRPEADLPEGLLAGLRLAGAASVDYAAADVTDPSAMRNVVSRMRERFGGVDGVIHSAFVLSDRTIARADDVSFTDALGPKVRGTVALCDALAAEPLDFLAFFSSAIAHTGNPGQSNYAAGSTFQDAYGLHLANALHWPVTVLDWGFWGDQGAVATDEHRSRLAEWGVQPISSDEGWRYLRQALTADTSHVVPFKVSDALAEVTPVATSEHHTLEPSATPATLGPVLAATRAAVRAAGEPFAPDYLDTVDEYVRQLVREKLTAMGLPDPAGDSPSSDGLRSALGVVPAQHRLFDALRAALDSAHPFQRPQGKPDDSHRREALLRRFPHLGPTLDLMEECVAALPEILTGARRGLDVLFPGGDDRRLAALYHDDPRTRHFNALCAAAVAEAVRTRSALLGTATATAPLRVLEIGAGTGGTTRQVLDVLDRFADRVRYDITDIAPSLLLGAERRFGAGRPYAVFRPLDIAANPAGQGFAEDRYDLVVATNVLHAVPDVRAALGHVARLMRPGALLVVNEATRVLDSVTPVFGLTDGWWHARDEELRLPHSPLLAPGAWRGLMTEAGMRGVRHFGVEGWTPEQCGQRLFIAERGPWVPDPSVSPRAERATTPPPTVTDSETPAHSPGSDDLLERTVALLTETYTGLLRMEKGELEAGTPLIAYGTDSLTTMEAREILERRLGPLPREVLTTGESVTDIARWLIDACGPRLAAAVAGGSPDPVDDVAATPESPAADGHDGGATPAHRDPAPRARNSAVSARTPRHEAVEPVAIVGLAGRYPGARDPETLWSLLLHGDDAIGEIPGTRWPLADHDDPTGRAAGRSYHRWGAFLEDIDRFDPLLFRISPREAERMDPAERLFLQTAWEALEDAGWPPSRLRSRAGETGRARVGVFVGMMHHGQYQLLATEEWGRGNRLQAPASSWSLANRVSHTFGFAGPSMTVDTACSSSLTALHLASASVRAGECTTALVGGVNLILHPSHHLDLATAGMLSRDGRSRVFDSEADGMVTGEGVGAVVVKRLSDAVRDGDRIDACVLGSAANSDGTADRYGVPSADAQVELIEDALRAAGIDAASVQYVEAQATGSPVGDPVELEALRRTYLTAGGRTSLAVGSLKPNIGHLEAASGMAQLTKALMQLRHGVLAPTLGADGPLTADGFQVPREPTPWPTRPAGAPRRAAVSSFGAGGANAHVILEEAPPRRLPEPDPAGPVGEVLFLSARTAGQLRAHAIRIGDHLRETGAELRLADVAHTLRLGREPLPARLAAPVRSLADAVDVLDAYANGRSSPHLLTNARAGGSADTAGSPAAGAWPAGGYPAARAWVDGLAGVAHPNEDGGRGRIVSLPSYPFAGNRYWLDLPDRSPAVDDGPAFPSEELPVTQYPSTPDTEESTRAADRPGPDAAQETLVGLICELLGVSRSDIDLADHLSDFGFDSVTMVRLADRLGAEFDLDVSPAILYGCRDVAAVVDLLTAPRAGAAGRREPGGPPAGSPDLASGPTEPPVREAPSRAEAADDPHPWVNEPVAVVGMAGAFPGSPDLDSFWNHLAAGRDLVGDAPSDRFPGIDAARRPQDGFLDGVDRFDAEFFQISPREARVMDPQHRLFLQTVWAAIEEAGHDPADLAGTRCGLYVGVASSEYGELARERGASVDGQLITGNDHSVLANRISFLLDLRGPSEPVDTACSSSLVAIHRAVSAIRSGECDLAIAGGVNIILSITGFDAFTTSGMLAADGRCKAFDHRADGYVRGEGVGAVLLKPLSRARADGDHIHGLITGSATNHGGRAASLTAPNPAAQAAVITRAQEDAGVGPEQISYVEAHGTGTALGDPIEVTGLRTAFEREGAPEGAGLQHCGLGTVKTNVGHLETAAGIAGLIKVLLALRHGVLPPTLHVERVNPGVRLSGSSFHLVTSVRPWQRPIDRATGSPAPRRAGVSSFGFGGMNAHIVVEEPPATEPDTTPDTAAPHLFVLSARTPERLDAHARGLMAHLDRLVTSGGPHRPTAAEIAYTLQVGRRPFAARLAVTATSLDELADVLRNHVAGTPDQRLHASTPAGAESGPGWDADDIAAALDRARRGDARRLAALWAGGAAVDWRALHPAGGRGRVTLPAYPFAPTSHWLPAPSPGPRQPSSTPAASADGYRDVPVPSAARTPVAVAPLLSPPSAAPDSSGRPAPLWAYVREAIADGIGIRPTDVDPAREFASYGVDSIGAMRIMQTIQARYGDHIPMAAILEHPSVDRLAAHLGRSYVLPDEIPDTAAPMLPDTAAPVSGAAPRLTAQPVWIPFTETETGVPAYCLFGDTGELTWLLHLSEGLAAAGPVLGLEAPGFGDHAEPVGDIADLARFCAEAVLARHGEGPCRVVGHGLCGFVAAETARLLLDAGVDVAELFLLGTPEPGLVPAAESPAASVAAVAETLAAVWGAGARPALDATVPAADLDARTEAAARLLEPYAPMPAKALHRWLPNAVRWRRALADTAARYRPSPLSGVGRAQVIRGVQGVEGELGDFDRWIAPPPALRELDRAPWDLVSEDVAREIAETRPAPRSGDGEQPSPLVSINRYGNGRRSFWAHNLYGEVSYAIYLSRHLGSHTPLIGMEQLGVGPHGSAGSGNYSSVKEMAAHYVSELREQFPGEPYLLGGCSFGGVLAYEMAAQLQKAGEAVSHLIVIDPIMPGTESWDSVDWGTVTEVEAESFSLVMLGNAMCQRYGVTEQVTLSDLHGLDLDAQLSFVARHIHLRAASGPDQELIKRQILVRHEVMLRNGDLLQEYRPEPLTTSVPTTLFHATEGFLAPGNDNHLPAVPRTSKDTSNGFAAFVGDRMTIHEMTADHHTIAHNDNLARIARTLSPLLDVAGAPVGMFPASLYPAQRPGKK
ncbi:SDR family NAD(P)-dependent oxidoreductase [Streptomyces anulatus]|uniref:SDR family NAD(P)-dependent oxidoreductase n=1 Tax=Streptomyces anulatus TaxID=1892 RepID=UPI00167288F9|nr:SDR family NAD(P)-dependent oxidoreductase [Streptomyces anulatus]